MIIQLYHLEAIVPGILMEPLPLPAPLARPNFRPLILGPVRPPPLQPLVQPPVVLPVRQMLPVQPGNVRGRGNQINRPNPIIGKCINFIILLNNAKLI